MCNGVYSVEDCRELENDIGGAKIRLLVLLPNLDAGGIQRLTLNVIRSLPADRYVVTLLVHERWGPLVGTAEAYTTVRYITQAPYSRWKLPRLQVETWRAMRYADVCLAINEGRAATLGLIAARLLRVPIVGVINFDWTRYISDDANSWRQSLSLRLYRYMTLVVGVSQGAAISLRRFIGAKADEIRVIPSPQITEDVEARACAPIPEDVRLYFHGPTVVAVGRLTYQKGLDFLIRAHAIVLQRGVDHQLILVGDGEAKAELASVASELGVSDSVVFAGFQQNPLPFVKASTVFAFPSRSEGQGLALAEAMICGAAIVASDCPSGPREMLDNGSAGILIEVGDVCALAKGIERLICDRGLRAELQSRAKQRALTFDHRTSGWPWQEVFEEAASSSP